MFTNIIDTLFIYAISIPVAGYLCKKLFKRDDIERIVTGLLALIGIGLSFFYLYAMYKHLQGLPSMIHVEHLSEVSPPVASCLEIDFLGLFIAGTALTLSLFVTLYSIEYIREYENPTLYFTLLTLMVTGILGTVFAGDLFTLFVFWELMSLSAYFLVAFKKYTWEAIEASFKYLVMCAAGNLTALYGISLLYGVTGTLNIAGVIYTLKNTAVTPILLLALVMIIIGFGVEGSIVPLHTWLPDAHPAAPSSISAMLSGIVIETGGYVLIRMLTYVFDPTIYHWQMIMLFLAIITMTTGNIMALRQEDIKRLLAYSSVAQMGYIYFGLSTLTKTGLAGSLFHIFNHAIGKGLAFLAVGTLIALAGTRNIDELSGIGRKYKFIGIPLTIAILSLCGTPPLSGFWSELFIIIGAVETKMTPFTVGALIMLFNVILSIGYYMFVVFKKLIWNPYSPTVEKITKRTPVLMTVSLWALALILIIVGIYPKIVLDIIKLAVPTSERIAEYVAAILGSS